MKFTIDDDQNFIKENIERFFVSSYDFSKYLQALEERPSSPSEFWRNAATLGWVGVSVSEDFGGSSLGATEAMLLMEEVGFSLCIEPFLETSIISAHILSGCTRDARSVVANILQGIALGETTVSFGWTEKQLGFSPLDLQTKCIPVGDDCFRLSGKKVMAHQGDFADWFLIPANLSLSDHQNETVICLVPSDAEGLSRVSAKLVDGSGAADIIIEEVQISSDFIIARGEHAKKLIREGTFRGVVGRCAESLGAMRRSIGLVRDYLTTRRQFGKPLSYFQALQHRFVDMLRAEERARSVTYLAVARLNGGALTDSQSVRDIHLCKYIVGECSRLVAREVIQLHGGMGMTYEYPAGHLYRKLSLSTATFGAPEDHLDIVSSLD